MNTSEFQNQIEKTENLLKEEQTELNSVPKQPAKKQAANKSLNFFLLGLVVVAAAAITGLGIYYFANIRQRQNLEQNTASQAQSQSQSQANTSNENTLQFYNGGLKLAYTLPKQQSYSQSEYQVLNIECQDEDAICKDIKEIKAMPAEWVVEETTIPPYTFFPEPESEFYGLRFSLLNGRFDNAQIGCEEVCDSRGLVIVQSFVSSVSLENAFRSLVDAHDEAYLEFAQENSVDLSVKLLERGRKWNLETFKVSLPVPNDSSNFQEHYLTQFDNRVVLVSIYYDTNENITEVNNLINSFNFR